MNFFKSLLFFIFLITISINGQVTVVDITTDTVAVFEQPEQSVKSIKSAKLAMLASAVVPGIGQQYIGKKRSALVFLGCDIISLFGAVFLEKYSRQLEDDAHGYAALHAGVDVRGKDERFWTAVGRFNNMKEYYQNLKLDRQDELLYTNESMSWNWENGELQSEQYQKTYNDFRDDSRKIHIASSVFIGAMIINRIISIVDIRASTKYKTLNKVVSLKVQPTFSSDFSTAGVTISTGF
ncbi:MAG TPA: hypothetical protein VHP36_03850 [Chitinispirillaceae bacterium]|nr:hypothetical protein [Chitinispirillaceae bacterium]